MGLFQMTIGDGERASSAAAFLRPALKRPNLTVISAAHATRVLIDTGQAVGVEYGAGRGKPLKRVYAAREVILSAGAFQSPHLLLLSGIGPGEQLRQHGLPVHADAPDVGRNLQDHFDVGLVWDCTKPITVYSQVKGGMLNVGLQYMLTKTGPGVSNHIEAGGFVKTRGELDRPDIQLHFFDANFFNHAREAPQKDGFAVHACLLRPESTGEIRLRSADPFDDPVIDPNYLATDGDKRTMRDSVRIVRDIINQRPLDLYRGAEFRPGPDVISDRDIDAWVRETGETIYHPGCSCRMGADDKAVLDAQLRVHGVGKLRVADASVMPNLVGGNTNAPSIMIGEKAADLILGKSMPSEDVRIAEDAA